MIRRSTILIADGEIRNSVSKLRIANELSRSYNVVFVTFSKSKLIYRHVRPNDNVHIYSFPEYISDPNCSTPPIEETERKLNFLIQKVLYADLEMYRQYLSNPNRTLDYVAKYTDYIDRIIDDMKIDFFFSFGEDRLFNLIPYLLLSQRGKTSWLLRMTPFYGFTLTKDFWGRHSEIGGHHFPVTEQEVTNYIRMIKDGNLYSTGNLNASVVRTNIFKKLISILLYIYETYSDDKNPYRFTRYREIVGKIQRKLKQCCEVSIYSELPEGKYIYFPFHYIDDAQIRLKKPEVYDQYCLARNIALNLPIGYTLAVKPHPFYSGGYDIRELRQLAKIPNISVINPSHHSRSIISHAKAVITVNSTVGYEALILGKPVFCLADPFYIAFSGVRKINLDLDKLTDLLAEENLMIMQEQASRNISRHVKDVLESSVKGGIMSGNFLSQQNLQLLYKCITTMIPPPTVTEQGPEKEGN